MVTQQLLPAPPLDPHPDAGSDADARPDRGPYEIVDAVGRIARLISRLKSEFAARHPGSPAEHGATSLLIALVEGGPKRAGALAEAVLMDPSQVSRRVQLLVRGGLVERRAEPGDGRAILLVATPAGRELCASLMRSRADYLRSIVTDWPAHDVTAFVGYLDRFAGGLERAVTHPPRTAPPAWDQRVGDG